jgi:membrane peptidoglycan carboxypeptidase
MHGRAQSLPQVLRLLGAFVVTAVALGLLMAGLAMPAVGASGAAANSSIAAFEELPSDFTASPLAQQSVILDAKGGVIATPYDENRIIVPLAEIAPIMQDAVIAIEDSRFYEHNGLDLRGLSRAVVSNLQSDDVQGASTITQQYVKIALQEAALKAGDEEAAQAATRVSLDRKVQELKYAMTLEKELSKAEILENYLNLVYFGDLAYGVEAAAQHYFSVPAAELNLGQSALLAGTIQNPGTSDPVNSPAAAERRRNVVLDRMEELGLASPEDVAAWKAVPVAEMLEVKPSQNTCQRATMPYVCQYVINWLLQQPELGETFEERKKQIYTGGLTIQTTFDPDIYQSAMRHMTEQVPIGDETQVGASAVVVEPGTGKILSLGQTSQYGNDEGTFGVTEVNWSVDQAYGESGGFQIGSTAKIYSLVRALEEGIGVETTVDARRYDSDEGATFEPSESVDDCGPLEPITVRNSEGDAGGRMSFRDAIAKSVNTAFIPLTLSKVGVCDTQEMMTRMGLHRSSGEEMNPFLSEVTLGSGESSPMTVALSFATLAANGLHCDPYPVTEVTNMGGDTLMALEPACEQVVEPDIVAGANEMLSGVMEDGTGRSFQLADGRVSAGKTGTTDRFVQSWFVGYTPQLATAVYVGRPDSNTEPMRNIRIGDTSYERVYGSTIAGPIWKRIMDDASAGMEKASFAKPGRDVLRGETVDVPDVAGRSISEARRILAQAGFDGYVIEVSARSARGTVIGTQPDGRAPKGSSVGILVSTGGYVAPTRARPVPPPAPEPAPEPAPDPDDGDGPGNGRGGGPPGGGED